VPVPVPVSLAATVEDDLTFPAHYLH